MKKGTWVLGALVALAAILAQFESRIEGLNLAKVQLFAFPIVALLFTRVRVLGIFVPPLILTGGVLSAAAAAFHAYLHVPDSARSFLVAQLKGDEFGISTRALRDKLNSTLRRYGGRGLTATSHHLAFSSHAESERLFAHTSNLPFVLWGTPRWLNLSVRGPAEKDAWTNEWTKVLGVKLVAHVPIFGLSYEPLGATTDFLANVVKAELLKDRETEGWVSDRELLLREAATSQAHWTSYAHRAYPLWELGNLYLRKAIQRSSGAGGSEGYFNCAIDAYTKARLSLKAGDNPELLAAALNNRAVAQLVVAQLTSRRELRRLARRGLKAASKASREKNLFGIAFNAPKVARGNLKGLKKRRHRASGRRRNSSVVKQNAQRAARSQLPREKQGRGEKRAQGKKPRARGAVESPGR